MVRHASFDEWGGTVWRSQAVESRNDHGLSTASLDRATHQRTGVKAAGRFSRSLTTRRLDAPQSHFLHVTRMKHKMLPRHRL